MRLRLQRIGLPKQLLIIDDVKLHKMTVTSLTDLCCTKLGLDSMTSFTLLLHDASEAQGGLAFDETKALRDDDTIVLVDKSEAVEVAHVYEHRDAAVRRKLARLCSTAYAKLEPCREVQDEAFDWHCSWARAKQQIWRIERIFHQVGGGIDGVSLLRLIAACDANGSGTISDAELARFRTSGGEIVSRTTDALLNYSVVQSLVLSMLLPVLLSLPPPELDEDVAAQAAHWAFFLVCVVCIAHSTLVVLFTLETYVTLTNYCDELIDRCEFLLTFPSVFSFCGLQGMKMSCYSVLLAMVTGTWHLGGAGYGVLALVMALFALCMTAFSQFANRFQAHHFVLCTCLRDTRELLQNAKPAAAMLDQSPPKVEATASRAARADGYGVLGDEREVSA